MSATKVPILDNLQIKKSNGEIVSVPPDEFTGAIKVSDSQIRILLSQILGELKKTNLLLSEISDIDIE